MSLSDVTIVGTSILSGVATFDGIAKSFPKASNPALLLGQVAVAGVNSLLAFGATFCVGYLGVGFVQAAVNRVKEETTEESEDGE